MINLGWKTHKKLLEAAEKGRSIYICSARGQNKTETERRLIEELLTGGRTVVYVRPGDHKKLQGSRKPWLLRDRDILTPERYERAERIWNEFWKEKRNG